MRRPILLVVVVLLVCWVATPAAGQDERTPVSRLRALKAERLAARPQATAAAIAEKTVSVNCAKHGSISAALASHPGPPPLVIELRGICKENVLIERNDVTLRGADPASDGIQGVTADPQPVAALQLSYANRILLENMFVADSPGFGVRAWFSVVEMRNCRIAKNGGNGIQISFSSALDGTALVVSQNTGAGITSQRAGFVTCLGCRLEDNHPAAQSRLGGLMTLVDTKVSGDRGIAAGGPGSYIDVDCVSVVSAYPCSVNVTTNAAQAFEGGEAALFGVGAFDGRVAASDNGWVGVYGGQQTLPVGIIANEISDSGRLKTGVAEDSGPPTTLARTHLSIFARASLYDATVLSGTLTCDSGADAWSDTPYPAAQVINCTNVPTTP